MINLKRKKSFKMNVFLTFLFVVYFFSNNVIYAQSDEKSKDEYLVPLGNVLQLDIELENIIVRNSLENSPFKLGDALIKINETPIANYSDFAKTLYSLNSKEDVSVLVNRNNSNVVINTDKNTLEKINFNNLISGFATLTYVNPDTLEFGAVGHPINVGNCRRIPIKNGAISTTTNLNIEKSSKGCVGSINATRKDLIGSFDTNTDYGIRGSVKDLDISKCKKYKVASLNEVKLGKAHVILQNDKNEPEKYDIEILAVENQRHPECKTFKIKITDKELLVRTGGIVQGMSGTPIVQGDLIVGAISHAVENDPSLGYGVFIEWMMDEK